MCSVKTTFLVFVTLVSMLSSLALRLRRPLSSRMTLSALLSTATANQSTSSDLKFVRSLMERDHLDAIIVPTDDSHLSEYTAAHFNRREYITGFSGSAGTAVITREKALLFTDGRYHRQAEMELGPDWTLMKQGMQGVPTPVEYLVDNLKPQATVGIDPLVHSATAHHKMESNLKSKNISIKHLTSHPVDIAWGDKRPSIPVGKVREHPIEYAGKSATDKFNEVRRSIAQHGATALVVTMLDEIAWLLNIRGSDVECNPVAICYAVLTQDAAFLFIDQNKVPASVKKSLSAAGVQFLPYASLVTFLKTHHFKGKVWVDGRTANQAVYSAVSSEQRLDRESPIVLMKACKNASELQGMRACHVRDGAAVVEFLAWLDAHFSAQGNSNTITEVEIDSRLTACRAQCSSFIEPSFATIAGVNENAAIMHYRAKADTCKQLTNNDLLLLDSGAQYSDGTTDVTRTMHTGTPTAYQREMFTRVLKGHIALDTQVFPQGTPGCLLDTLARQHLWAVGKNFLHGTGHGVGAALNVHEGPQRISPLLGPQELKAGMIVSNEPGYYEDGNFGIRIENLLEVVENPTLGQFGGKGFLGFQRLTYIPMQVKMMDTALMSDAEIAWVNNYHREVRERILPVLSTERARRWLHESTAPLIR